MWRNRGFASIAWAGGSLSVMACTAYAWAADARVGHIDQGQGLWQDHRTLVITGLLLAVVQTCLILALVVQSIRHRRMETALRVSEEANRALVEGAPDGIVIYDVEQGRFVAANHMAERIFGIDRQTLFLDGPLPFCKSEQPDGVAPADRFEAFHLRAIRGEEVVSEWNLLNGRGEDLVCEVRMVRLSPSEEGGSSRLVRASLLDITARRRQEEQLLGEAKFRTAVLDAMRAVVLVVNADGSLLGVNRFAEELTGYPVSEIKGTKLWDLPSNDSNVDEVLVAWRTIVETGSLDSFESRVRSKQGKSHTLAWSARLIRDGAGKPDYVIAVALDMTERLRGDEERSRLEGQLRHAQKMEAVGQLAGGVAHDMNNMLAVILGHLDMMQMEGPEMGATMRHIAPMEKIVMRSKEIVRQLLMFSRKQEEDGEVINLNIFLAEFERSLGVLLGEEIHVIVRPGMDLWHVKCDSSQVHQIIMNLAVNARDAMPEGGPLLIETANHYLHERDGNVSPGRYVVLSVVDTGIGMDEPMIGRIFEPFFTTKDVGRGTGLGLSTVFGIVQKWGGFIRVQSQVGLGTTFQVFWPALEDGAEETNPGLVASAFDHSGLRVLLVEDDLVLRDVVAGMLAKLGAEVVVAESSEHALDVASEPSAAFDLLLTDVVMPGMNGFELSERIQAARHDIRVLFMSGYAPDVIANKGLDESRGVMLAKPFRIADLSNRIAKVMGKSARRV